MKAAAGAVVAIAIGLAGAGCAPVIRTHGYVPVPERLAEIEVGRDTRGSVQRKIGRPSASSTFDDDGWYYVSTKVRHETYKEPKVIERTVLALSFDRAGLLTEMNRYGLEDGRVIDLETRTTPTYGRQLTILEQLIGNLGSVRGQDLVGDE